MSSLKDLTGRIFGRWTVIERAENATYGLARWRCKCSCGTESVLGGLQLRSGASKSCGCLKREMQQERVISFELKKRHKADAAKLKAQDPFRRVQKTEAQARYSITDKAALAQFHRWGTRQKKPVLITDAQLLRLREQPCHKCGHDIPRTGVCFSLVNPRGSISFENARPTCGICKLIKPKENFDPIAYAKKVVRRYWNRTPMASIAKQTAKKAVGRYECALCKGLFRDSEIEIDHISPVIDPSVGYVDLETWTRRLLCDENNLQCLCKVCHSKKTSEENTARKLHKNAAKNSVLKHKKGEIRNE